MAQIASEDYPNLLIYLHIDTVTNGFDPAEMQKEHRALRRLYAGGERKYDPMVSFVGNEDKGGGKKTPRSTRLRAGVRIVPYDTGAATQYSMDILNEILNVPDGLADQGVFDRSGVAANVDIDKGYDPVEVIEIVSGSGVTEQDKLDIADRVWDETLTAAQHNTPTSAGRRLRGISTAVIITGTAVSATVNSVVLDNDASAVDGAYDPALIAISNGTGAGQARNVFQYDGATKRAWVDRNWKVTPDATSEYTIIANAGREHINEGVAQGAGASTITLNTLASPIDEAYTGQIIFIRSGTGEDQALRVIAYNGTTKVATMCDPWAVVPDTTSVYAMLPTSIIKSDKMAEAVWDTPVADHQDPGSMGERLDSVPTDTENADATWNKTLP